MNAANTLAHAGLLDRDPMAPNRRTRLDPDGRTWLVLEVATSAALVALRPPADPVPTATSAPTEPSSTDAAVPVTPDDEPAAQAPPNATASATNNGPTTPPPAEIDPETTTAPTHHPSTAAAIDTLIETLRREHPPAPSEHISHVPHKTLEQHARKTHCSVHTLRARLLADPRVSALDPLNLAIR